MKLTKAILRSLSLRLSLLMVFAIAVLLIAALSVMFHFSRQALREEAMLTADHTLDATAQHIDNILLSAEQTAGNFYWDVIQHLDQPERMEDYCRELVKSNRYIAGCAIAFEPNFYPGRKEFMAYVRKTPKDGHWTIEGYDTLEVQETFHSQSYTVQDWFTKPMSTNRTYWMEPLKDGAAEDALITFSLPIYAPGQSMGTEGEMKSVGVMGVDIPLSLLYEFILATKPSANGYVTLLGNGGTYIVHPDPNKLFRQTVFTQLEQNPNASIQEAGEAMVKGESGFMPFNMNGEQWYVIFKPFQRTEAPGRVMDELNWSVGVIYPEDDIFGEYNLLLYYLLAIVIIGLTVFFILCRLYTHRQLLPLVQLTRSAQRIADGDYNEPIPPAKHEREDEIGQLQQHFQEMRMALTAHIDEQERLSAELQKHGETLQKAYSQAQEADQMKTSFLHHMTNQMVEPTDVILKSVKTLCNDCNTAGEPSTEEQRREEMKRMAETIQQQSKLIIELLKQMIHKAGKEGAHV
ncbi:MAG: HAMP domain-containing protein [Prevotella sp.]|nr:HAMP domain-containing protein [Prevotella sp.]